MNRVYLHPLALRIWHWLNAAVVFVLVLTGIQLRAPGIQTLRAYDNAVLIHRCAGWAMTASFLFWLVYSVAGTNMRQYLVRRSDLAGALSQVRFYLFAIFRGEENPFLPLPAAKFNALQKFAYGFVQTVLTPLLVVTGILFSDILFFRRLILLFGGVRGLDAIHLIGAYAYLVYVAVHIYMSTIGRRPLDHIKAMIVGYEEERGEDA